MSKKPVKSAKAAPSKSKPAPGKSTKPAAAKTKTPDKSKGAPPKKTVEVPKEPEKKAATKSSAKFKQGEMVVYPFHGVGVVKSIEKMNITGVDKWYYTLDFRNGELTVKLPVEQQDDKGMRRVVGKADVETIMVILRKKPPSEESDWKVRYNQYLEKLKSGDIYEAAKVARNLSKRGPEGELSMSEKRLLEASVQLLVHEIATASREPIEKVESEISKCLRAGRA
ncbi:MAG: CarD family transcriptional regulator [Candidatus Hydrogenedentota bacterium]